MKKTYYNKFTNEQRSHFGEKVSFDKMKKTVTYHVPAHEDIPETDVLEDFRLVSVNISFGVLFVVGKGVLNTHYIT